MENEIKNDIESATNSQSIFSKGLKVYIIIFLSVILLVFGYVTYLTLRAPYKKALEFQEKYKPAQVENEKEKVKKSREILALENEITFQKVDFGLTNNDSIYILIDLVDSLVCLELQGVVLHETKIIDYEVSRFLRKLDPQVLNNFISHSFKVTHSESTIEKSLLRTKIAPKNEEEANAQQADTLKPEKELVRFTWYFDRDLKVEFIQDSIKSDRVINVKNRHLVVERRKTELKEIIHAAKKGQATDYDPYIRIVLQDNDVRTVYRSTPYYCKVALRLGFEGMIEANVE